MMHCSQGIHRTDAIYRVRTMDFIGRWRIALRLLSRIDYSAPQRCAARERLGDYLPQRYRSTSPQLVIHPASESTTDHIRQGSNDLNCTAATGVPSAFW